MNTRPHQKRPRSPEVLYAGRYLRLVCRNTWEFTERIVSHGAVVVVALTDDGKLLLTEQYREPVANRVIELPAGLVGDLPHERTPPRGRATARGPAGDPSHALWAETAQRELLEETGYRAARVRRVAGGPISSGLTNEHIEFYLASGLTREGPGGGVDGEQIRVHAIRLDRLIPWLRKQERAGLSVDPKIFAGVYFAEREHLRRQPAGRAPRSRPPARPKRSPPAG